MSEECWKYKRHRCLRYLYTLIAGLQTISASSPATSFHLCRCSEAALPIRHSLRQIYPENWRWGTARRVLEGSQLPAQSGSTGAGLSGYHLAPPSMSSKLSLPSTEASYSDQSITRYTCTIVYNFTEHKEIVG